MAETVKVLVPEEDVAKRIKRTWRTDQQRLCGKAGASDLRVKGRSILYV